MGLLFNKIVDSLNKLTQVLDEPAKAVRIPQLNDLGFNSGLQAVSLVMGGFGLIWLYFHTVLALTLILTLGYPSFKTIEAVQISEVQNSKQWLAYWILIGLFTFTEETFGCILQYIPYFEYIKIAFFFWCSYGNGAFQLYDNNQQSIDRLMKATGPEEYVYTIVKVQSNAPHRNASMGPSFVPSTAQINTPEVKSKLVIEPESAPQEEERKAKLSPVKTIVQTLDDKTDSNGSVTTPVEVDDVVVELKEEEDKPALVLAESSSDDDQFNFEAKRETGQSEMQRSSTVAGQTRPAFDEEQEDVKLLDTEQTAQEVKAEGTSSIATFGAGCFWCVEGVFARITGVTLVMSGYAGGHKENPTYKEVCSETTGHTEVIQVSYDPSVISFQQLVKIFFTVHDPTTKDQQGNDKGFRYRSAIFFQDEEQKKVAEKQMELDQMSFMSPIVTAIVPFTTYYEAEENHQNRYDTAPGCGYTQTKVKKALKKIENFKEFDANYVPR